MTAYMGSWITQVFDEAYARRTGVFNGMGYLFEPDDIDQMDHDCDFMDEDVEE